MPAEFQHLASQWTAVREGCLQAGSLSQVACATLQLLQASALDLHGCLLPIYTSRSSLTAEIWEDRSWQLAILEQLVLAGWDIAESLEDDEPSPWDPTVLPIAHLCWDLLRCVNLLQVICTRQQAAGAGAVVHAALLRMELPQLYARMAASARCQLERPQLGNRGAVVVSCGRAARLACYLLGLVLRFADEANAGSAGPALLRAVWARTLRAIADSQLLEHTARLLLPLAVVERQLAAQGGALNGAGSPASADLHAHLQAAFAAWDVGLHALATTLERMATVRCGKAMQACWQRLLGGPCTRVLLAARLTEALHALDGGGRAGLPDCLPYTSTDDINVGLDHLQTWAQLLAPPFLLQPPAPPTSGATGGSHVSSCSGLSLGSTYQLMRRVLNLAFRPAPGGAAGEDPPAEAVAAGPEAPPASLQARLPQPLPVTDPASARGPSAYALLAAVKLLGRIALQEQRGVQVEALACGLVPAMVGLLHWSVSHVTASDAGAAASYGHAINVLEGPCRKVLRDVALPCSLQRRLAAAASAGLVPALQACIAWPTLERLGVMSAAQQQRIPQALNDALDHFGAATALLAPERQAAALAVALRSAHATVVQWWLVRRSDEVRRTMEVDYYQILLRHWGQLYLRGMRPPVPPAGSAPRVVAFALQQWAISAGRRAMLQLAAAFSERAHFLASGHWLDTSSSLLLALLRAQMSKMEAHISEVEARVRVRAAPQQAGQEVAAEASAAAAELAAARRAVASLRALLLRDMRLLDGLACGMHAAARAPSVDPWVIHTVEVLQLAAVVLRDDVMRHVAAGQAAARGRPAPPSAAGHGPEWLTADAPLRALLGARRCNRPALLAFKMEARVRVRASAAAAELAAARRAVASLRALLLRDMRLLDGLACGMHAAARAPGVDPWVIHTVEVLQLAAVVLPDDVMQHVAAGQAAARGRPAPPSAAGHGPEWLTVDAPLCALLGARRCNRPALLAFLEGRSSSVPAEEVVQYVSTCTDLGLPPPCDAALLDTCAYPGCTDQAHAAAAARSLDVPPLRACAKCGEVRYCSRACQTVHWAERHKAECGKGWWQGA